MIEIGNIDEGQPSKYTALPPELVERVYQEILAGVMKEDSDVEMTPEVSEMWDTMVEGLSSQ